MLPDLRGCNRYERGSADIVIALSFTAHNVLLLTLRRCVRPSFCFLAVVLGCGVWQRFFSHATAQRKSGRLVGQQFHRCPTIERRASAKETHPAYMTVQDKNRYIVDNNVTTIVNTCAKNQAAFA